jgi:hypothetical protein
VIAFPGAANDPVRFVLTTTALAMSRPLPVDGCAIHRGTPGAFGSGFARARAKNRTERKRAKRAEQKAARRKNRGR